MAGWPLLRRFAHTARGMPPRQDFWADVALDLIRQDPVPSAALVYAMLVHGFAPSRRQRRPIVAPALVIAHHGDPVHPFADAQALVDELPGARLLVAQRAMELRRTPERLTEEIADFLDACWAPRDGDG